jgi:PEP-CTERM motif
MGAVMAKRRTDSNRPSSGRRNFAAWLMMLLPGFMFVGLLAPAAVHVKATKAATDDVGPISFRNFAPRRPIQYALPLGIGIGQGAASQSALEPMFSGARYLAEQAKRAFEAKTKDSNDAESKSDQIVLNDDNVQTYVAETLFEAPMDEPQPQLVVDLTPLWDPNLFDVMPFIFDRTARTMWDDAHGTSVAIAPPPHTNPGPVVPEPATGALFAFGLVAFALRRNRA